MAEDATDEVRRRVHDIGDQVSQATATAKEYATDAVKRAGDSMSESAEQLRSAGEVAAATVRDSVGLKPQGLRSQATATGASISEQSGGLRETTGDAGRLADAGVQGMASDAADAVRDAAVKAARTSQDFLDATRQQVTDVSQRATRTMRETIEQHPILVASAGLLLGGLIASALPKLEMEENLIGDASKEARKKAQEAAARGFEAVKGAADEIVSNVARKAEAEGLTPDGLAQGLQDAGQRLQRVAERGITTAFEPKQSQEDQIPTPVEGKDNG